MLYGNLGGQFMENLGNRFIFLGIKGSGQEGVEGFNSARAIQLGQFIEQLAGVGEHA